jgi:hypothetical protein
MIVSFLMREHAFTIVSLIDIYLERSKAPNCLNRCHELFLIVSERLHIKMFLNRSETVREAHEKRWTIKNVGSLRTLELYMYSSNYRNGPKRLIILKKLRSRFKNGRITVEFSLQTNLNQCSPVKNSKHHLFIRITFNLAFKVYTLK